MPTGPDLAAAIINDIDRLSAMILARESARLAGALLDLLPQETQAIPIAAEILDGARGELEPCPQVSILEEDVGVLEAGSVQILPLAFLSEDSVNALDQADML